MFKLIAWGQMVEAHPNVHKTWLSTKLDSIWLMGHFTSVVSMNIFVQYNIKEVENDLQTALMSPYIYINSVNISIRSVSIPDGKVQMTELKRCALSSIMY